MIDLQRLERIASAVKSRKVVSSGDMCFLRDSTPELVELVTDLTPGRQISPSEAEKGVQAKRHHTLHLARLVGQTWFVLHSGICFRTTRDLKKCNVHRLLALHGWPDDWEEDQIIAINTNSSLRRVHDVRIEDLYGRTVIVE